MPTVKIFSPPWSQEELILLLEAGLEALRLHLPLQRAYLFGSWAKGRALPNSDVDLLLIYQEPRREDLYRLARKAFARLPLELHAYTVEEAQALGPVLARMLEGACPLRLGLTNPPPPAVGWDNG